MAAPETLRARQAALLLHGMPVEARDRVLSRLSPPEAARLQPLLRELAGVGASRPPPTAPPAADASARERAASLSGALVARAVSVCAPVTVAALLRIAEWPWRDELLARCPELRRAEVKQHLRGGAASLPPAVAEGLCERLCQAAAGLEADRVPSPAGHESAADYPARGGARTNHRLRRMLSWTR
jgi:hypothetical protein